MQIVKRKPLFRLFRSFQTSQFVISVLILWTLLSVPACAQAQEENLATLFKNVRVFDGDTVIARCDVLIKGGRIVEVTSSINPPKGANLIDGEGHTLMPGLFDSHVHVIHPQALRQCLIFGVTAVIDMFMDVGMMASIKREQESNPSCDMAFLISAGTLATAPGGHGTQYGIKIPTLVAAEEAEAFVEDRISEGSDFIKIIYDDGSAYGVSIPTLRKEVISALVDAAHRRGKMVVIHAATLQNFLDALDAGVDGFAHLYFDNSFHPEFGAMVASRKAFVIPTLTVIRVTDQIRDSTAFFEDADLAPFLSMEDIKMLKADFGSKIRANQKSYDVTQKALRQLREAGVTILAGTDAPNPGTTYGASIHQELELLVKAGLSNLEALRSATSLPAVTFGCIDRGYIRPGYIADLLLVRGDPLSDITATRKIVGVWKNGSMVDRESYRAMIQEAKKSAEEKGRIPEVDVGSGLISDFDGEKITSQFGAGWAISTDAMIGGKSTADFKIVAGGALGSKGSLLITGEIAGGGYVRWAGAFFSPGSTMMAPANLSSKKSISFWAKGDGKTYSVMVFAQSLGYMPAMKTFVAGPEWQEFEFSFQSLRIDGSDITGIFIGGSQELGPFSLQVDEVRLK